ncbi:YdeI family protein [Dietzia sp. B32]|uniref:YdeI/OmpD-associated family protein n=1 Tax=Dietzia sp. B32 TaxID=2915130 RepID=UPI0021AD6864|nr:YdeI/OmpD-associated family protein [Dietzia sp. B32]UVE95849.1 YdeI/OmpD-associated family protein [Dietzia sp. B32]
MSQPDGPQSPVVLATRERWREWLCRNDESSAGIWLMLAKKGVTSPTSLSYQEALEEALCSGWIDGQRVGYDEQTYVQRFTPRRARSLWSLRNVEIVARLAADQRLRPRGVAEIDRAKSDGRWDRAYPGQATAQPPESLDIALEAAPAAKAAFARLTRAERFSALLPLLTATNEDALERRVARLISRLTGS